MQETEFRAQVQEIYARIEKSLDSVDPDLAECEIALGSLTISFPDRSRCILSVQPSVRQIWLAVAARGVAHHFNFDQGRGLWRDDKGQGIELLSFLEEFLREKTGLGGYRIAR